MAKTIKGRFDLFTLCCKGQLIGTGIQLDDNKIIVVSDWYSDFKTNEIHLEFENDSDGNPVDGASFDLGEKFFVEIDVNYKSVQSKKKGKNHKKR